MSQIRLYLDEDASARALVKALCQADIDVVTVAEVDRLSLFDGNVIGMGNRTKKSFI